MTKWTLVFLLATATSVLCICIVYQLYWESLPHWTLSYLALSSKNMSHTQFANSNMLQLGEVANRTAEELNSALTSGNVMESSQDRKIKTILFWNSWYHRRDYMFGLGTEPFIAASCEFDNCRTTADRNDFPTSDIVMFFGRLLPYDSFEVVPKRAFPDQLFAFVNTESPVKTNGKTGQLGTEMNITMTYRRDSTIPWPAFRAVPINSRDKTLDSLPNITISTKTHAIAWMISHCRKRGSVRMEYVKALSQFIGIDIYGACGNLTCGKRDMQLCMQMLESKYFFYLAFENSICTDYITEKVFRTLQYNLVPIVMGGANYLEFLPPNSYINVEDFSSPKHLAHYLEHLQAHPEEYSRYFEWKREFEIVEVPTSDIFCRLCAFLHSNEQEIEDHFDVGEWWEGDHCEYNMTRVKQRSHLVQSNNE